MFLNIGSGLKEYIAANPVLHQEYATTIVHPKSSDISISSSEYEDEVQDEFYDAIAAESSTSDEESDDDEKIDHKVSLIILINYKSSLVVYNRNKSCLCVIDLCILFVSLITYPIYQEPRVKLKNVAWAITTLSLKRTAGQFFLCFLLFAREKELKLL